MQHEILQFLSMHFASTLVVIFPNASNLVVIFPNLMVPWAEWQRPRHDEILKYRQSTSKARAQVLQNLKGRRSWEQLRTASMRLQSPPNVPAQYARKYYNISWWCLAEGQTLEQPRTASSSSVYSEASKLVATMEPLQARAAMS